MRFSRDVTAARSVSGLFTAPVVDADVDGPMPWLATAYVPGPSLSDAVREHGPLPAPSVLALAAGLAEGLAAIHAAGLIHRDLKPSNVLLAEDGPRVIDFGISRAAEATALTHADLVIGSPGFMSPEQAEGRETGPPSDVFSLGRCSRSPRPARDRSAPGPPPPWSTAWFTVRLTFVRCRRRCGRWPNAAWPRTPGSGPLPERSWPSWATPTSRPDGCPRRSSTSCPGGQRSLNLPNLPGR